MDDLQPEFLHALERLSPGTELRRAMERIIQHGNGALVVLGSGSEVDAVCSGGFVLQEAAFTAARLAELAKMDGAVVVTDDGDRIVSANVHLVPDSNQPTEETGSRHRTAERVARQTGKAVVAISEDRSVITLFLGGLRRQLESPTVLGAKVHQSLLTLERFRSRLDASEHRMTRLEVADVVTNRAVVEVLQRAELVLRIGYAIERDSVGLGGEGDLVRLQLSDLLHRVDELRGLVVRDYVPRLTKKAVSEALAGLDSVPTADLFDRDEVAAAVPLDHRDAETSPRGIRLLSQVPRLPESVRKSLIDHFGEFQKMLRATVEELDEVGGIGLARAVQLRAFFDRLTISLVDWESVGE